MMTKIYKVNGQRGGGKVRFSVDEVDQVGKFICQAAFFFKTRQDAEKRMVEMISEDAAEAPFSFFRDGKCVANTERKSNGALGIVASAAWPHKSNGKHSGLSADTDLIAAAPDLLEALEALLSAAGALEPSLSELDMEPEERDALDLARAAIAKARGEA